MSQFASILDQANDARTRIREIESSEIDQLLNTAAIFLDVREENEFETGHLPGAIQLSWKELHERAVEVLPNFTAPVVAYCTIGHRSAIAADILQELGYQDVVSVKGGLQAYDAQPRLRAVA